MKRKGREGKGRGLSPKHTITLLSLLILFLLNSLSQLLNIPTNSLPTPIMSFSLISLSSSSLSSYGYSFPLRKFPPLISLSELSSPPSTLYTFSPPSSTASILNSSIFNRPTIRPLHPTCFLPIYSYSNFSSMSSGSDATPAHALVDDSSPSTSATDELGVSDSDDDEAPQCHPNDDKESSSSLPERWHVLGLGQAMVISPLLLTFSHFFS